MHSYAQTNIQLFNQLRTQGYSSMDLSLVRDAYELAMILFTGRFTGSGRSFIAHVVRTASILASLGLSAQAVAAGLLHNVYESGDFGGDHRGISTARRQKIRQALNPEVETYIARFPALYWEPRTTQIARDDPEKLDSIDRTVLLILFADHLEHLLDSDVLYYDDAAASFYISHSKIAAEIAERLGLLPLAAELKEAIRAVESAELPGELPGHKVVSVSPVVVPKSCRKRFSVMLWQFLILGLHRLHPQIQRALKGLYLESAKLVKRRSERNGAI